MKETIVVLLVAVVFTSGVRADKLYLQDGRKLSGAYKRKSGNIEFTTDDGETISFTDEEVDRLVRESSATLVDLEEMFYEFEELVSPALGRPVVQQRDGLEIKRTASGHRITGHRMYREPVSSDRYVDDWVTYAAKFEAIEGTQAYKRHMHAKHGKVSIGEYSQFPREGHEEIGAALKTALKSVKGIFALAARANRVLYSYRKTELRFDERIRDAGLNARDKKTSKGRRKAQHDIQWIKNEKISKLNRLRLNADNLINRVAAMRIITFQRLDEARELIEAALRSQAE